MGQTSFNLITQMSLNDDAFKAGITKVKSNVKDLIKGVEGATGNIQEMRKALMTLRNVSFAGKSVEEIKAINKQIGNLMDEMGDLKSQQKALGTEFGSTFAKGLQGITAIVEAGVGVASFFGASEESAKKFAQVMTSLIGISQAFAVIQSLIEERTFQIIALRTKEIAISTYQAVSTWANTTALAANAAATAAAATITGTASLATKAAAAATWLWNAALLANPIVLIAAAVAALAAGIYLLIKAFSSNDDAIDKQKEAYKQLNDQLERNQRGRSQLLKFSGLNTEKTKVENLKLQITLNNQRIKDLEKENGLISAGIRLKGDITDENPSKETIKNLELQKEKIDEINKIKDENAVLDLERQYTEKDYVFLLNEELGILEKKRQNKILNKESVIVEEKRIAQIKESLKLVEEQKKGYDKLSDSISKQEKLIKDTLATGGIVSPEMLLKLEREKLQLEKINSELETIANISNRIKPITLTNKQISDFLPNVEAPKTNKLEENKLAVKQLPKFKLDTSIIDNAREVTKNLNVENSKRADDLAESLRKQEISQTQYNVAVKKLNQDQTTNTIQNLGVMFGEAASMFAEHTAAFKALSIAQALMNTYVSATLAYKAGLEAGGPLGLVLGPVFAGVAVAAGLANVAKIAGVFAQGGVVPGSSYSGDRVPIMANSGEMILNYGQQASLFSMINSGIGGNNEVRFEISGDRLVGVLSNYTRKINSIR